MSAITGDVWLTGANEGGAKVWTDQPVLACHLCGHLADHNTAAHGTTRAVAGTEK